MQNKKEYQNGIYLAIDRKCIHLWRYHHGTVTSLPDSTFAEELTTGMRCDLYDLEQDWKVIDRYCTIGGFGDPSTVTFDRAEECKGIAINVAKQVAEENILIGELVYANVMNQIQLNEGQDVFSYMDTMEGVAEALCDTFMFHNEMFRIMGKSYDYDDLSLWLKEYVMSDNTLFQRKYLCELVPDEEQYSLRYFFNKFSDYYAFVLLHFAKECRWMTVCQFCGRVFVPKTKRTTLYCDRVDPDIGKPCNQIAPKIYMEDRQRRDPLLSEYEQARNRNYKRVERTMLQKDCGTTGKSLKLEQYEAWFRAASESRRGYLSGDVSAEEFRTVIHEWD